MHASTWWVCQVLQLILVRPIWGLNCYLHIIGKEVVVLEAKVVASGNSGRHTGDITTWKRQQYSSMLELYDKDVVTKIAQSHKAAVQHVEQVCCLLCPLLRLVGNYSPHTNIYLAFIEGKSAIHSFANQSAKKVDFTMQIVKEHKMDCDLKRVDGYVYTYAGQEAETKVQKELSAAKDAQLADVRLVSLFLLPCSCKLQEDPDNAV